MPNRSCGIRLLFNGGFLLHNTSICAFTRDKIYIDALNRALIHLALITSMLSRELRSIRCAYVAHIVLHLSVANGLACELRLRWAALARSRCLVDREFVAIRQLCFAL